MNTVILAVSQKWQDEQLVRDTLRKLHDENPDATIRVPDPVSGAGKDAREFADTIGFKIEKWKADSRWPKYPTEIRNGGMISGLHSIPLRCEACGNGPHTEPTGPPADLLLAFWTGGSDNVKDLINRYLVGGYYTKPIVVYREKWLKKRGQPAQFKGIERATNQKERRSLLADWKPVLQQVRAAA